MGMHDNACSFFILSENIKILWMIVKEKLRLSRLGLGEKPSFSNGL